MTRCLIYRVSIHAVAMTHTGSTMDLLTWMQDEAKGLGIETQTVNRLITVRLKKPHDHLVWMLATKGLIAPDLDFTSVA